MSDAPETGQDAAPEAASAAALPDAAALLAAHGDGFEAVVLEIFGHRRHAGFAREEERFGAKMLRIDVPTSGDPASPEWVTHWYGGASIFSLTSTDAGSVFKANAPYRAAARLSYRDDDDEEPSF